MAYNTKNILRSGDASPIPIPQFYNPTEDAFNPLTGANLGSGRYGADGVMWGKTAGGVYIPVQVNANGEVLTQLSGSKVEIGGVAFEVSGGDTLRGKSADKPDAVAAHAVIPYCYYFSIDTGVVEATDGTNWVVI